MRPVSPKIAKPRFVPLSVRGYVQVTLVTLQRKPVRVLLRWQGSLAVWRFGWAQEKRTAVSGWNLLDGSSDECAHESYHQDSDPDCTFHGFVSYSAKSLSVRIVLCGPEL